jgi:hypothetical protein
LPARCWEGVKGVNCILQKKREKKKKTKTRGWCRVCRVMGLILSTKKKKKTERKKEKKNHKWS